MVRYCGYEIRQLYVNLGICKLRWVDEGTLFTFSAISALRQTAPANMYNEYTVVGTRNHCAHISVPKSRFFPSFLWAYPPCRCPACGARGGDTQHGVGIRVGLIASTSSSYHSIVTAASAILSVIEICF
jgi:hypothetical protein